ncbi:MAG: hydroxyacylglutathione hydrolase [Chromatiaceae bacterium]|nr:hydroxyacylglutathione hydrolase [Gammaproteobacteria bacterium]MCP5301285.1 hydroxyacylglutathione hydrolase [Chromatiaceae bacterium]MCP5421949.1 hydroxyacylglutathione hydrolase [Chromatiaceae bacterium]
MIEVSPIPAFDDNYIWLLTRPGTHACAVVDPGDEDPVIERLQASGLELRAILITHKHGDHVGGIRGLKERWPGAVVYGPAGEPIKSLERRLHGGDRITLNDLGVTFDVLDVPGHTEGHIAYHDANDGMLFCGDTLFAAGCGRVFSGTFEQLSDSLVRIGRLPPRTRLYCAHEYTLANLGFAAWVEPDSAALAERTGRDEACRARGEPTVPSTVADELATNPFMRTDQPAVIDAASRWAARPLGDRADVFRALRTWKDKDYD